MGKEEREAERIISKSRNRDIMRLEYAIQKVSNYLKEADEDIEYWGDEYSTAVAEEFKTQKGLFVNHAIEIATAVETTVMMGQAINAIMQNFDGRLGRNLADRLTSESSFEVDRMWRAGLQRGLPPWKSGTKVGCVTETEKGNVMEVVTKRLVQGVLFR